MANAQALQCWAERANLPIPGQPCLLQESVPELHKRMEHYVSFSDDIVLGSVALPEGFFGSQTSTRRDALPTSSDVSSEEVATHVESSSRNLPHLCAAGEVGKGGGSTKPIPQLGEGVTPLSASHCSGTNPTSLWGNEAKAPPLEL